MVRVCVVMPVGPDVQAEFLRDSLDSLEQFVPDHRLIVLDDSRGAPLTHVLPERATVIAVQDAYRGWGGELYRSLSLGFREALCEPFDVLLRMDTDAVLLGGSFAERAHRLFAADPRLGALGSCQTHYDGRRRIPSYPAWRLRKMMTREAWRDPARTARIAGLLIGAYGRGGYERGRFIVGGVTLYGPRVIRALARARLLDDPRLGRTNMGEDHIFGLCMSALGYEMRDFGTAADDLPMAVEWKGLPASPQELIAAGKEIVHSTKSHGGREERDIREVFRRARQGGPQVAATPS